MQLEVLYKVHCANKNSGIRIVYLLKHWMIYVLLRPVNNCRHVSKQIE